MDNLAAWRCKWRIFGWEPWSHRGGAAGGAAGTVEVSWDLEASHDGKLRWSAFEVKIPPRKLLVQDQKPP